MPGYYDTNGVWNFAEDDPYVSESDTLNKLGQSASSAIGTAKGRVTAVETELNRRVKVYKAISPLAIDALFPPPATKAARLALQAEGNLVHVQSLNKFYKYWAENDSGDTVSDNSNGRTPAGWYPADGKQTGWLSANSNGSGIVTVTHGLGVQPFVFMTPSNTSSEAGRINFQVATRTNTTFTVQCTNANTGTVLANAPIRFYWMAVAPDFQP
ncbi:hypothetical protein [Herbiconiux sp. VKM Ac-2851]|uniref:hypothetical protein n=1 Tax=Herbiconiux sp. VKM Ac-2851 TaxID=2739025 RepID=UPI0015639CD1|nr:hypothetical protein [Herbiconiux sp. VKM Ac-2851]NQX34057.1 hypothetical protein [Herbiconiux sp. VKM Ac-2851]